MRISLSNRSGWDTDRAESASSPLCSKVVSNPSCVKTSQSSSQVTMSSSTTRMRGGLRGICCHLKVLCCHTAWLGHRKAQHKDSAQRSGNQFDAAAVFGDDVTSDHETEPAP